MEFFVDNILIVFFLPLWVVLSILLNSICVFFQSRRLTLILTLLSTLTGLVFSGFLMNYVLNNASYIEHNFNWLSCENYNFYFGYFLDKASALMLIILFSVSFLVQLYSYGYTKKDISFHKFFVYLNLFNFSMIGLILSSNLIQMYIFWELVGVCSYLLIGFYSEKKSVSNASKKAFLINRFGDCCFLVGIISLLYFSINYQPEQTYSGLMFSGFDMFAQSLYAMFSEPIFNFICICLFMGSIAKSAQFPLHVWLIDAMEAPTPVSALIHAATMVAAGVFLTYRLLPLFELSNFIMMFILIIAVITSVLTALIACFQNDFKKILAFSTCSQLGLMFIALSMLNSSGALIHLTTHAYFKALLFLCAGCVLYSLANLNSIKYMGGLRKYMPIVAFCYLIGAINLSGFCFSGFYSKEIIFTNLFVNSHYILFGICLLISFLSAFYIFRSYFLVFEGEKRFYEEVFFGNLSMKISIVILAVITMFLGFLISKFTDFHSNIIVVISSISSIILAFCIVYFLHKRKKLNSFVPEIISKPLENKLYFDEFYLYLAEKIYKPFCKTCQFVEKYIRDGIVNSIAFISRIIAFINSKIQTGNIQSYILYSSFGISIFLFLTLIMYMVIKG